MRKLLSVLFLFFLTNVVQAQYLKLDNGIVFSSFYNNKDLPILSSEGISSYSFLLGADYFEKDWFYLSSQVGYTSLGGGEKNTELEYYYNNTERADYIHLNTTIRIYGAKSGSKVFAGVGPYVNILTSSRDFETALFKPAYQFKNLHAGGRTELGFTQDINKFRIGLMGTFMFGLSPSASSKYLPLINNAFSVMITTGYRLQ